MQSSQNPHVIDLADHPRGLLSGTQLEQLQRCFTVKMYTFKGLSRQERLQLFEANHQKLIKESKQFADVCQSLVQDSFVNHLITEVKAGNGDDYIVVISSSNFVLGYAILRQETITYDSVTTNFLRQPPHNLKFDDDKTINIKLLCSRAGSGMGKQVLRVVENLAIRLRCASLHLDAVSTAYNFYKHVGFSPYVVAPSACSTTVLTTDEDRFSTAIHGLARKMQNITDDRPDHRIQEGYDRFLRANDAKLQAVIRGVVHSRLYPEMVAKSWFCHKNFSSAGFNMVNLLKEIVRSAFTENGKFSDISMTKCLMDKGSGVGLGGSGTGSRGGDSGYGGGGSGGGGGSSTGGGGSGLGGGGGSGSGRNNPIVVDSSSDDPSGSADCSSDDSSGSADYGCSGKRR